MKRSILVVAVIIGLFFLGGCKKHPGSTPSEADLAVQTVPASGSFQPPAIEPFNLTVTITSAMPSGGVKIDVSARKDDGSGAAAYFSTSINTSSSTSNFTITNTPVGVQCIVEIKVTSLSKSSNQWSGSYHYTRKS